MAPVKYAPRATICHWNEDRGLITRIRYAVFTLEQGIPTVLDFDGLDEQGIQALVWVGAEAVGTARMLSDGHLGRIAVLGKFRGLGAGSALVSVLETAARERELKRVYLNSQVSAQAFYERLGFVTEGCVFVEAGLEHIAMVKPLE